MNVDLDWVKAQLTAARARRGAGDAVLHLIEAWNGLDISSELSAEAVKLFSELALGHSLTPENPNEVWVQAQAGQLSVGNTVRVRSDAFSASKDHLFNGRVGSIVAIRTGRIVVKSTDGIEPEIDGVNFRAEQLDLRVK